MKADEQKIIDQLKQGENLAYKYIYDQYYGLLCAVAREFLGDHFLASNLVDDLIFHLWEKRETLDITTSLRSYLVRAVRNRCINHLSLERERRELTFSSMNTDQQERIALSESIDYPLTRLLEDELENEIKQAIDNLPSDCRKVFCMSRHEGKRYEEIAQELGISVNTVKYHMKNAMTRLTKDLSRYLAMLLFFLISH